MQFLGMCFDSLGRLCVFGQMALPEKMIIRQSTVFFALFEECIDKIRALYSQVRANLRVKTALLKKVAFRGLSVHQMW